MGTLKYHYVFSLVLFAESIQLLHLFPVYYKYQAIKLIYLNENMIFP